MIRVMIAVLALCLANVAFAAPAPANKVKTNTPAATPPEDPVEKEYEKILETDDEAQEEVDKWIRENNEFAEKGGGVPAAELNRRILNRFKPVREAYEDFIRRHPKHTEARVAYASFLGDIREEEAARDELEKALAMDTNNPAVYNNLANIYGHIGPDVKKAFDFYTKAIQLNPKEPVYYHNFGTTVYLFRKDAREHYNITEDEVFNKAMALYSNAMWFDPTNFPLASDVAQSYYGIKPARTEDALQAWTNAFNIANDDIEREGVHIHFARVKLMAGRFDEARRHLGLVKDPMYNELKRRVVRNLNEREQEALAGNKPTGETTNAPAGGSGAP